MSKGRPHQDAAVTVPVPPSATGSSRRTDPSAHASAPAVTAVTAAATAAAETPAELRVAVRRRASSSDGTPLRAAFVLAHVDDRATVAQIAAMTGLPRGETEAALELLVNLGLIELSPMAGLTAATAGPRTSGSGFRRRD